MVRVIWIFILSCCLSQSGWTNKALDSIETLEIQKGSVETRVPHEGTVLVFFYMGSCSHCHRFAPILDRYSRETGMSIQSFTLDGKVIDGFEEAEKSDVDLEEIFFPHHSVKTPALFLVNIDHGEIYTVSIGALSEVELKSRMEDLQKTLVSTREKAL